MVALNAENPNKILESTHICANNCNVKKDLLKKNVFTLSPRLVLLQILLTSLFRSIVQRRQDNSTIPSLSLSFRPIDKMS